jgi:hypothetical protein
MEDSNASTGARTSTNAAVDLQQLLVELSQYSSTPNQTSREQQQVSNHAEQIPEDFSRPQQLQGPQILQHQRAAQNLNQSAPVAQSTNTHHNIDPRLSVQHHQVTTPPTQSSRTPLIDPAVILDWPQALRCINKIAAHNPNLAAAINRVNTCLSTCLVIMLIFIQMIADQESNVQQWWKDREALLVRQAGRVQSIEELNETM